MIVLRQNRMVVVGRQEGFIQVSIYNSDRYGPKYLIIRRRGGVEFVGD